MPPQILLEASTSLLPVILLVVVLHILDGYKLVEPRQLIECLIAGMVLAVVSYFTNSRAIGILKYDFATYSRFAAPVAEEFLKAAFVIVLFARNRIGFMIDAAIMGFAVGAGFSLTENLYYLYEFPTGANLGVWIIRGFGTAIMHGGATAIFGVMGQGLTERRAIVNPLMLIPGLAVAVVVHGVYNYFQSSALIAAVVMLVAVPMILVFVFAKSEHGVHTWLLHDYESHEHLLEAIKNGEFTHGEAGRFILDVANKFDPEVVADLFAYIRLHTELAIRADKVSLAHETGEKLTDGHALHESFKKLHALEKKIGRAVMLAIWPHLHFTRRELWELNELEAEVRHA
jgi:RsiW-degrading membrane proteinase PrsW (M82 family)